MEERAMMPRPSVLEMARERQGEGRRSRVRISWL